MSHRRRNPIPRAAHALTAANGRRWVCFIHTLFFLPQPSCPSSSVTMGKVCLFLVYLITNNNDSPKQDTKPIPSHATASWGGQFLYSPQRGGLDGMIPYSRQTTSFTYPG